MGQLGGNLANIFNMATKKYTELEPDIKLEKRKDLKKPSMYQVFLLNDDYTPMDFVVEVLIQYFFMSESYATSVMLQVHHCGKAVCGVYTREIAETKVVQVSEYAKIHAHPLLCQMETT